MDITVALSCKCGWFINALKVPAKIDAELIADRHERTDTRRPYRHDTSLVEVTA